MQLFYATFDVKLGHSLLKGYGEGLAGVEYKAIPSSFHQDDVVYLSHHGQSGVAVVVDRNIGNNDGERQNTVFALGVLADEPWNYLNILETTMKALEKGDQEKVLNGLYSLLTKGPKPMAPERHPIYALVPLLTMIGPEFFEIHRQTLLRNRLLIALDHDTGITLEQATSLVYILGLLGASSDTLPELNLQYNVTVQDSERLAKMNNYLAVTSDTIMLHRRSDHDVAVHLSNDGVKITNYGYPSQRDSRRYHVLTHFIKAVREEGRGPAFQQLLSQASHSQECSSAKKPLWRQFYEVLANNMLWLATAGEISTIEDEQYLEGLEFDDEEDASLTLEVLLVGYFQQITNRLNATVQSLVTRDLYREDHHTLTLAHADVLQTGLEMYNSHDEKFLHDYVERWWNQDVVVSYLGLFKCC